MGWYRPFIIYCNPSCHVIYPVLPGSKVFKSRPHHERDLDTLLLKKFKSSLPSQNLKCSLPLIWCYLHAAPQCWSLSNTTTPLPFWSFSFKFSYSCLNFRFLFAFRVFHNIWEHHISRGRYSVSSGRGFATYTSGCGLCERTANETWVVAFHL